MFTSRIEPHEDRPVGSFDDSPAIHRWVARTRRAVTAVPSGTVESALPRFDRPYGTSGRWRRLFAPAVNCWAIVKSPSGARTLSANIATTRGLGLHRNQDGTISILSVFAVLVLTMLLGMVMNVGRQVDGKLRMQNAADAAAYSGGVVLARGMNSLAFTNHLLCDVFAVTAFLREARDRNAESYVPQILDAWAKEGPVFGGAANFPKFQALGPAITQKVPLEQELVRSFSEWAKAVSDTVLPLVEEILSKELIPQYQQAVVWAMPDIAQAATMEVARRNGQPDFGRGDMLGALWRSSGQLVGGGNEASDPTLSVVDPQFDPRHAAMAHTQRSQFAQRYLDQWNNQTLAFFDYAGKMSQFAALWRSFTCGQLHQLLDVEYADRNLPYLIPDEAAEAVAGGAGNSYLDQHFTFLGVVYWKKPAEWAPKVFQSPIDSDPVAFAEVRVFVPQPRLVWIYVAPGGISAMPIGGVPGEFPPLPNSTPPQPGPSGGGYWEVGREGVPGDWTLWNQHWTCQLVPATTSELRQILQTPPSLPAFAGRNFVLPKLGNLSSDEIGRISAH
jgi:hypothetical protein